MCSVIHHYILLQCYVVSLSGDGMPAAVWLKRLFVLINEHTIEDTRWHLLENIRGKNHCQLRVVLVVYTIVMR